jgi:protein-L-isoaspartate(D-aspartate) O-methyltransferase
MEKAKLLQYWKKNSIIKDEDVLKAFNNVPREIFVRKEHKKEAYGDYPLSIGHSQTISQPTTVMIMTQSLEPEKGQKVLEIGAGSGWQAAIISKIVGNEGRVITTEIIPELAEFAKNNLKRAGINNVEVIQCDGSVGYQKEAPYDRIIITAACPKIPSVLIEQLKTDGIIIAPVGSLIFGQEMIKLRKTKSGTEQENLGSFVFVPLKGKHGF